MRSAQIDLRGARIEEASARSLRLAQTGAAPGLVERAFTVDGVAGILWSPALPMGPAPLVLIGHAGGRQTRSPGVVTRAVGFVRTFGFHAAAIGAARSPERAVAEWRTALDALLALPAIDADRPVGYLGGTGATEIGLRLAAADGRIGVQAFCGASASEAEAAWSVACRLLAPRS